MTILERNNVHILGTKGPVIFYAHGFGCNQNMWSNITPHLPILISKCFLTTLVAENLILPPSIRNDIRALMAMLKIYWDICDALNLSSGIIFVGHSVSCSIGLLVAIARPKLFERLILIGPSPCF